MTTAHPVVDRRRDVRLVVPAVTAWLAAAAGGLLDLHSAVVVAVAATTLGVIVARRAGRARTVVAAAAACGLAGLLVGAIAAPRVNAGPLPSLAAAGRTVTAHLTVTGDPRVVQPRARGTGRASEVVVVEATTRLLEYDGRAVAVQAPVVVLARDAAWRSLLPSSQVRVRARVTPPMDAARVAAALSARGPPVRVEPPALMHRVAGDLRAGLREAAEPLPREPEGLLPGLVDGDTSALAEEVREDFRTTGLSHLLAVSGANVAIVAAAALGLARGLGLGLRSRLVFAGLTVLGFVVLARPSPSVLRAAVMGLIGLGALASGRRRAGLPALAAAVLLLVLVQPSLARSDGFVLSVLATAGLLLIAPSLRDRLARRLPRWLADGLAVALAAQVMTTPYVALRFDRVSLVSVPANLLAAAAVPPATVLGVVAAAVAPLCMPLAQVAGFLGGLAAWWIVGVAHVGADVPSASVGWPDGAVGAIALLGSAAAAYAVHRNPALRRPLAVACAAAVVAVAGVHLVPKPWPPKDWAMVACDVGQGDAVALATEPGSAVLVDAGPDPAAADRCLVDLGVRRLALVVLTHFHADHVGGLPGAVDGRAVGELAVGPLDDPLDEAVRAQQWASASGVPVRRVVPGEVRVSGAVRLRVLAPHRAYVGTASDPNNSSVVLHASMDGFSALLTGDIEPTAQDDLLARGLDLRADVLKIPHHGSRHQSPMFLRAVGARLAVASAGVDNDYGHPAPEVLSLLGSTGAHVWRTDLDGAVAFAVRNGALVAVSQGSRGSPARPAEETLPPAGSGLVSAAARAPARVRGPTGGRHAQQVGLAGCTHRCRRDRLRVPLDRRRRRRSRRRRRGRREGGGVLPGEPGRGADRRDPLRDRSHVPGLLLRLPAQGAASGRG